MLSVIYETTIMIKEKNKIIEDLIPIYRLGNKFFVILKIDIPIDGSLIEDSLLLEIETNGSYSSKPWSGQKILKFGGGFESIPPEKRHKAQKELFSDFSINKLQGIRQLLLDPPKESVESLIYIPTRLSNKINNNQKKINGIKVIAFDADDTLWVNEPYYQDVEKSFCELLKDYLPATGISKELLKIEIQNIEKYGYGAKGFMLSMIETAIKISNNQVSPKIIDQIIILGKSLLDKPIELLDNIEFLLQNLKNEYQIIVATKGDLLDQQRKLKKSGLLNYFHHIEIMSEKKEDDYYDLIKRLKIEPSEFLMVGNSIKSDILPVISIGGKAIHIPYHTTWEHETVNESKSFEYFTINKLSDLLNLLP